MQDDVKSTLEVLRNAGLKIWMLTGDKVETATNIAVSSKLISRTQSTFLMQNVSTLRGAQDQLNLVSAQQRDCCLIIDGRSLQFFLDHMRLAFIAVTVCLPAVVCCRCSPTQKASIGILLREFTGKRICAIGDGGNDVSMIQAADVGVGIVGKEGKQASLAADFSVTQFSHLTRLLLWHGRNSYKRSSKLSQFVFHRGMIISVIQAVFSALFYFAPIALYQVVGSLIVFFSGFCFNRILLSLSSTAPSCAGFTSTFLPSISPKTQSNIQGLLLVGYSTFYTMAPVFSLVLDKDVSDEIALLYPELYKDLTKVSPFRLLIRPTPSTLGTRLIAQNLLLVGFG